MGASASPSAACCPIPWQSTVADLKVGDIVDGTVTKIVNFGAFVRVKDGLEGLIHISELSHQRVAHPGDVVHEGQTLKLKIISLDSERHRLGLSLKQAEEAPARPPRERRPRGERGGFDRSQAIQEPEGGIDNTLAAAFAQVRQQIAEQDAASVDGSPSAEAVEDEAVAEVAEAVEEAASRPRPRPLAEAAEDEAVAEVAEAVEEAAVEAEAEALEEAAEAEAVAEVAEAVEEAALETEAEALVEAAEAETPEAEVEALETAVEAEAVAEAAERWPRKPWPRRPRHSRPLSRPRLSPKRLKRWPRKPWPRWPRHSRPLPKPRLSPKRLKRRPRKPWPRRSPPRSDEARGLGQARSTAAVQGPAMRPRSHDRTAPGGCARDGPARAASSCMTLR